MNYSEKKTLLLKFKNRKLNATEQEAFFELFRKGEYGADFQQMLDEIEQESSHQQLVPESLLNSIKVGLNAAIDSEKRKRILRLRYMSAAAIILVFIGISWLHISLQHYHRTQNLITVSVPSGKTYQLKLDDGTIVRLVSGSVFRYPEAFAARQRQVYLDEGNALFNVAHDKKRPFTVRSGKLATTALGTSFTVQNNKAYSWEKVSLYTGKVVVKLTPEPDGAKIADTYLVPGQSFEVQGAKYAKNLINNFKPGTDPVIDGSLTFNSTPFKEALYQISSYYKIHIHFDKDLSGKVNGTFQNQSAEDVLGTLTQMYQLNLKKISDSTYAIAPSPKPQ